MDLSILFKNHVKKYKKTFAFTDKPTLIRKDIKIAYIAIS